MNIESGVAPETVVKITSLAESIVGNLYETGQGVRDLDVGSISERVLQQAAEFSIPTDVLCVVGIGALLAIVVSLIALSRNKPGAYELDENDPERQTGAGSGGVATTDKSQVALREKNDIAWKKSGGTPN